MNRPKGRISFRHSYSNSVTLVNFQLNLTLPCKREIKFANKMTNKLANFILICLKADLVFQHLSGRDDNCELIGAVP